MEWWRRGWRDKTVFRSFPSRICKKATYADVPMSQRRNARSGLVHPSSITSRQLAPAFIRRMSLGKDRRRRRPEKEEEEPLPASAPPLGGRGARHRAGEEATRRRGSPPPPLPSRKSCSPSRGRRRRSWISVVLRRRRWTSRRSGLLRWGRPRAGRISAARLNLRRWPAREGGREGVDGGGAASPQIRSCTSCSGAPPESSGGGRCGWWSPRGGWARGERAGPGAHGGGGVREVGKERACATAEREEREGGGCFAAPPGMREVGGRLHFAVPDAATAGASTIGFRSTFLQMQILLKNLLETV
jgi:hypothetical protein